MPMKTKIAAVVCALTGLMLLPLSAAAMRCGSALINEGDSQAKVLARCGEPARDRRRGVTRTRDGAARPVPRVEEVGDVVGIFDLLAALESAPADG